MKRVYETPALYIEAFAANEYVAACYKLACQVGTGATPPDRNKWSGRERGDVSHSKLGTPNTCADANANRILTDDGGALQAVQEHNYDQGWINGQLDYWVDVNQNQKYDTGDRVYWYTTDSGNTRRWNHWGIIEATDSSHPNHS